MGAARRLITAGDVLAALTACAGGSNDSACAPIPLAGGTTFVELVRA